MRLSYVTTAAVGCHADRTSSRWKCAADGPLTVSVEPAWRRSRCGTCGKRAPSMSYRKPSSRFISFDFIFEM